MSELLKEVQYHLDKGNNVLKETIKHPTTGAPILQEGLFFGFKAGSLSFIERIYGTKHDFHWEFKTNVVQSNTHNTQRGIQILEAIKYEIENGKGKFSKVPTMVGTTAIQFLEEMFDRFDNIVQELKGRRDKRPPLIMNDEYDVQYLLQALLRMHFDDIRPEDYVPDYAGSASRIDFGLRAHNIVVEAKMTRPSLKNKEIGEQLVVDIKRYRNYPYCKVLYCFVYDPSRLVTNPRGLENDLFESDDDFKAITVIRPH